MSKRYLFLVHRIFLKENEIKKGGADYIIDSLQKNYIYIYFFEFKLNEYSEYKKNENVFRLSIKYKSRKKQIILKKFKNYSFFYKFICEILILNYFLFKIRKKFNIAFSINPINTIYLLPMKFLGKINKIYFHLIDYSEERFESSFLNFIYKLFLFISFKYSFVVGFVSSSIKLLDFYDDKKFFYIPNSPLTKSLYYFKKKKFYDFIMIIPKFDIQTNWDLLIKSLHKIKKLKPSFKIAITGYCDYQNPYFFYFKNKINSLGLKKNVIFLGYISDKNSLSKVLYNSNIAITCYANNFYTKYSKYADSLKIREYAAHGLPIISEGLFYNSLEAKVNRCCYIYNSPEKFLLIVKKIFSYHNKPDLFLKSIRYNKLYDKKKLISKLFQRLGI